MNYVSLACIEDDDLRRDRIIQFATAAFLERGYDNTNIEEIAAAAHVSKRTIYRFFGSKENVLRSVIGEATAAMVRAIDMDFDTAEPIEEVLTEFGTRYFSAMMMPVAGGAPFYELSRLMIGASLSFPGVAEEFVHHYSAPGGPSAAFRRYMSRMVELKKLPPVDLDFYCRLYFQIIFFTNDAILQPIPRPPLAEIRKAARVRVRAFLYGWGA